MKAVRSVYGGSMVGNFYIRHVYHVHLFYASAEIKNGSDISDSEF